MKTVFKKNQVIITALAIMLAVAGYLNFTKEKSQITEDAFLENDTSKYSAEMFGSEDAKDVYSSSDNDEYADISDEDMLAALNENQNITVSDTGELITSASNDSTAEEASAAQNSDNGEVNVDESQPGEAVLASTVLDSGFFANAKLTREQTRSKNREMLMELAADETISEENRQAAIDSIIKMAEISELENAAELLLEAKGFEGVVVNIASGNVDVVVNAESITDAEVAQIEDIVMRKTEIKAENIVITTVITQE